MTWCNQTVGIKSHNRPVRMTCTIKRSGVNRAIRRSELNLVIRRSGLNHAIGQSGLNHPIGRLKSHGVESASWATIPLILCYPTAEITWSEIRVVGHDPPISHKLLYK